MPINQSAPEPADEEGVGPHASPAPPDGVDTAAADGAAANGAGAEGAGATPGDEYEPL
jgi:hypothetical protein